MNKLRKDIMDKCLDELLSIFQKYKLTTGEIVIIAGNLLYALGASIGNYKKDGPSIKELEKMYYTSPKLSTALMINGIQITLWHDDINKVSPENNPQDVS